MKLGEEQGCRFDDLVDIELSPDDLEWLANHFQEEALKETSNFAMLEFYQRLYKTFLGAYDRWRKARNEKDDKK